MQIYPVLAAVIDLDITYFFQLILFLVLVFLLTKLAFTPLLQLFERRRAETDKRAEEAQRGAQEAGELMARYQREMAQATSEGMAVRNRARDQALREEAERLTQARMESAGWLDGEVAKFVKDIEKARVDALPEVERMALDMVQVFTSGRVAGDQEGGQ